MFYHIKSKFDAAHALIHHEGKCRHLHGHTYHVTAHFAITDASVFAEGGHNMPVDFARLKGTLEHVLGGYDHRLLLSEAGYRHFFRHELQGVTVRALSDEPTAETMARDIYNAIKIELVARYKGIGIIAVTLYETEEQGVTYMPSALSPQQIEGLSNA